MKVKATYCFTVKVTLLFDDQGHLLFDSLLGKEEVLSEVLGEGVQATCLLHDLLSDER